MNTTMQEASADGTEQHAWQLRWAAMGDLDGLYAIACQPAVYRYRFDGKAPAKELFLEMIEQSKADDDSVGIGLWVVEAPMVPIGGCVQLQPDLKSRSAELSYLLDPAYWGRGLGTRMAWTAISKAFTKPDIDCVFAGADCPNQASIAIMSKLGMRFRRHVRYPLGPGIEYEIRRDDPLPSEAPALLRIVRQADQKGGAGKEEGRRGSEEGAGHRRWSPV